MTWLTDLCYLVIAVALADWLLVTLLDEHAQTRLAGRR